MLSETDWDRFFEEGFLHLGPVGADDNLDRLRDRVDDLAAGRVVNSQVEFQPDTGGTSKDLPGAVATLETGTVLYRKVQGLEHDDLYGELVRHSLFVDICIRLYGPHASVSLFRAMEMNKPAGQGTVLPWHQDGGSVWALDRDPLVTVWVALHDATPENGCIDVIPGSHRFGLLSWYGSTVSDEDTARNTDRIMDIAETVWRNMCGPPRRLITAGIPHLEHDHGRLLRPCCDYYSKTRSPTYHAKSSNKPANNESRVADGGQARRYRRLRSERTAGAAVTPLRRKGSVFARPDSGATFYTRRSAGVGACVAG